MNNTRVHQILVDDLLLAFGSRKDVRCWPRVVGTGRALSNPARVISFGIPGETDIDGIVKPFGRRLAIEVKTGTGRLTQPQEKYRDMILSYGGIWILARSVEQALTDFERAL